MIKNGVTAAGHALPGSRRRRRGPTLGTRPGREASQPPGPPGGRPRPLLSCSTCTQRPGLCRRRQAAASPPCSAASSAPVSGRRQSLPAKLRSRISPSCPGWPARPPSRIPPQSGLPARAGSARAPPPEARPAHDVRAPLPDAQLLGARTKRPKLGLDTRLWRCRWQRVPSGGRLSGPGDSALFSLALWFPLVTVIAPSLLAAESIAGTWRTGIDRFGPRVSVRAEGSPPSRPFSGPGQAPCPPSHRREHGAVDHGCWTSPR
ncbi:uncharacterized protein LOC103795890 [Callithrix jacchus]